MQRLCKFGSSFFLGFKGKTLGLMARQNSNRNRGKFYEKFSKKHRTSLSNVLNFPKIPTSFLRLMTFNTILITMNEDKQISIISFTIDLMEIACFSSPAIIWLYASNENIILKHMIEIGHKASKKPTRALGVFPFEL